MTATRYVVTTEAGWVALGPRPAKGGGYYVTKERSRAYACSYETAARIVAALQVWHDGVTIEPADGGRQ